MKPLTFGSLFAGIGGLDLGLERAGMECRWQVEIDPYATKVLEKHWPHVKRYSDVRTVGAELERVDLICGGFPCQDISNAGKRAGIDGERSGLWSEYARIVRVLRPRFVLVENVAALLGRGLGRVVGDLASIGYDAEWDCIPACAVGAPHIRERLFLVAYATGSGCEPRTGLRRYREPRGRRESAGCCQDAPDADRQGLAVGQGERSNARQEQPTLERSGVPGRVIPDSESVGCELRQTTGERPGGLTGVCSRIFSDADRESLGRIAESRGQRGQWATEPDVGRVAHGVPARVDRLRGLGNAVVPQVAEWIGRRIIAGGNTGD